MLLLRQTASLQKDELSWVILTGKFMAVDTKFLCFVPISITLTSWITRQASIGKRTGLSLVRLPLLLTRLNSEEKMYIKDFSGLLLFSLKEILVINDYGIFTDYVYNKFKMFHY